MKGQRQSAQNLTCGQVTHVSASGSARVPMINAAPAVRCAKYDHSICMRWCDWTLAGTNAEILLAKPLN